MRAAPFRDPVRGLSEFDRTTPRPSGAATPRFFARGGTSVPEVLVVIGILSILMSLVAPAVQQAREASRAASCRNNLRQLVIAAQNHESAHRAFPYTSTAWWDSHRSPPQKYLALSVHRYLMEGIDAPIYNNQVLDDPTDPVWPGGPGSAVAANQKLLALSVPIFLCPSDDKRAGAASYRANVGISSEILPPSRTVEAISQKGAFVNGRAVPAAEFSDGLSNTALFSERVLGSFGLHYDPFRDIFAIGPVTAGTSNMIQYCAQEASPSPRSSSPFLGANWMLGGWLNTWYSHATTPNSNIPDCATGSGFVDGGEVILAARSFHPGGVHVAMADGAIRFVSNSVNTVVWRAVGTRNGRETEILE